MNRALVVVTVAVVFLAACSGTSKPEPGRLVASPTSAATRDTDADSDNDAPTPVLPDATTAEADGFQGIPLDLSARHWTAMTWRS